MKSILALLLSFGVMTAAFAQSSSERDEARRVILGEKRGTTTYPRSTDRDVISRDDNRTVYGRYPQRYPDRYPSTSPRERSIYEINRAYDARIYSVQTNRWLSRREKSRMIRNLELDRRRELASLNDRYDDNRYDNDRHEPLKKYDKRDRGHHYGWERGQGNPHGRY